MQKRELPKYGSELLPKFMVRLPQELKDWVADQSKKYGASMNSEIVRALQERKDKVQREEIQNA